MRPTFDFSLEMPDNIDVDSARYGTDVATAPTERITLPEGFIPLNQSDEEFFAEGDAGTYEGGPAEAVIEVEIDDPTTLPPPPPSPEQLRRRSRASRGVALVVGAFAAMSIVGLARVGIATAQSGLDQAKAAPAVAQAAVIKLPLKAPAAAVAQAPEQPLIVPAPPELESPEPAVEDEPAAEVEPEIAAPPAKKPTVSPAVVRNNAAPARAVWVAPTPPQQPVEVPRLPAAPAPAADGPVPTAAFPVN